MEGLYRCVSQASGERKTRNYRASEGKTPLQNMLMCVCVWMCVWMLIGMPCMELGVRQEYSMRAVMGECVECISESVANQVSLIGHGYSQRSDECSCSVYVRSEARSQFI